MPKAPQQFHRLTLKCLDCGALYEKRLKTTKPLINRGFRCPKCKGPPHRYMIVKRRKEQADEPS